MQQKCFLRFVSKLGDLYRAICW